MLRTNVFNCLNTLLNTDGSVMSRAGIRKKNQGRAAYRESRTEGLCHASEVVRQVPLPVRPSTGLPRSTPVAAKNGPCEGAVRPSNAAAGATANPANARASFHIGSARCRRSLDTDPTLSKPYRLRDSRSHPIIL